MRSTIPLLLMSFASAFAMADGAKPQPRLSCSVVIQGFLTPFVAVSGVDGQGRPALRLTQSNVNFGRGHKGEISFSAGNSTFQSKSTANLDLAIATDVGQVALSGALIQADGNDLEVDGAFSGKDDSFVICTLQSTQ